MNSSNSIPPWVIPEVLVPVSLWSFGPIPRPSSEGFLVTFTPGFWRIQVYPRWSLSEDLTYLSHRSLGFITFKPPSGRMPTGQKRIGNYSYQSLAVRSVPLAGSSIVTPEGPTERIVGSQGGVLGSDLMNPRTQGILETLNPTDEGLR